MSAHASAQAAPLVVKLGGRALETPEALRELAADLAALAPVVLVHGGGAEVSTWSEKLGFAPRFSNGRRVTDAGTLEVATAVLAGLSNKRLVARLREAGVDAVGLAALDGGIADIVPHAETAALGAVGEIRSIDASLLRALLESGRVPVLASIGSHAGELLNVNADDLAGALAAALRARALVLLSDVPGVKLSGAFAARLDRDAIAAALESADVSGGMGPKLAAAALALDHGVASAHIGAWGGPGSLRAVLDRRAGTTLASADSSTLSLTTAQPHA